VNAELSSPIDPAQISTLTHLLLSLQVSVRVAASMNFLYRTAASPPPAPGPPQFPEQEQNDGFEKPIRTLEGLIAEDPHMPSSARPSEDGAGYGGDFDRDSAAAEVKSPVLPGTHTDVTEVEGWITIPHSSCF
jgi:hypothetical protein